MRIAVVGAGGFAREVRWLIGELADDEDLEFGGFVVSDVTRLGPHDSKEEVIGDVDWLCSAESGIEALALGIGSPSSRLRLAAELTTRCPRLPWPTLVHPTVQLDRESASLGRGAILCAGVVGTVNVTVAEFAVVNLACTLGHECVIGRGAVLNPTVNVSGGALIGEGVLVGTGAQILQYQEVGDGATIGAGAVVTRPVEPGVTVVGIPARPLQKGS